MERSEGSAREYAESIINTVRELLLILDQDLRVITVSRSFYEFFQVKPEETIGQFIYDLDNNQWDIPKLRELLENILPRQTTFDNYEVEQDFAAIGRRIMLVNGRQIQQKPGAERIILLAIEDITERKMAEEALRVYRTVADFTYAMETWRTPDGKYQYVSPSCERITGYSVAEFLADPTLMIKIAHPEDQSKVINHYKTVHRFGTQNLGIDFRILTPTGDIRWVGHSCTAVYDSGGAQLGRRESNRDITKRIRVEEEKEKLEVKNRLLQKSESLNRMAGAIAHHFNNKLHVVMGHLEVAMDSLPEDEKFINNLIASMQAAEQAAEVSRSMLTYLGQVTGVQASLDLSAVCRRCLPLIQSPLPKNVAFAMDLPSPGPTIIANPNQIQLILTNLINNSWEAVGDTQGKIQLTVKTVSSADIPPLHRFPIDWQADDQSYSCLEVRDTGCGLLEKSIDEVFDPFFSTKFTGRGLGLSVVLGLVQVHSGVVTIVSTLGQGSVFRVFFPITAEEVPFLQDKELKIMEIPWSGTVLLVDDDEVVMDITSQMLAMLGFEVLSAGMVSKRWRCFSNARIKSNWYWLILLHPV